MMSSRIPSVTDTYFQHKVLSKVHGQPTYETLQTLSTEVKANAASVPSTLGGGLYGHLGLIMSDERYATLANSVPWVTPGNPGPFNPPNPATAPQIEAAKDVWRELKYSFELCQATEKALIAQIVDSIDPIYLRALLNRATGQYSSDIKTILVHLFATHGKITPQQIKSKEMSIYNMSYDISMPVDNVFNAIDDLSDLSENGGSTMTTRQMIDLAYVIFAKLPILQNDLCLWNRRPLTDKTWANMLTHFCDAQTDLGALPTAGDMFHQEANGAMMSTMADLVTQRLLDVYPPPTADDAAGVPLASPPTDTVNAAIQQRELSIAAREAALVTQMNEMMTLMRGTGHGATTHNQQRNNRSNNRGRGGRSNDRSNGGRGRQTPNHPTRLYCWSHGACAHSSNLCNTQLPGHQTTATFANMQGGSTNNCFWLPN